MMVVSRSMEGGRKKFGRAAFMISGSCVHAVRRSSSVEKVGRFSGMASQHSSMIL